MGGAATGDAVGRGERCRGAVVSGAVGNGAAVEARVLDPAAVIDGVGAASCAARVRGPRPGPGAAAGASGVRSLVVTLSAAGVADVVEGGGTVETGGCVLVEGVGRGTSRGAGRLARGAPRPTRRVELVLEWTVRLELASGERWAAGADAVELGIDWAALTWVSGSALEAADAGASGADSATISASRSCPAGDRPSEMADRCAAGTTVMAERPLARPGVPADRRAMAEAASMWLGTLAAGSGADGRGADGRDGSEIASRLESVPVSTSGEVPGRGERCGRSAKSDERP